MKLAAYIVFAALLFDVSLISEAHAQANNPGWWNGNETQPFAGGVIRDAYCDVIGHIQGEFGGMLMVIAGILAFGAAALGDFKHGVTVLVVGIGAYTISALVSLYFGELCGGNAAGTNRTNQVANVQARSTNLNAAFAIGAGGDADFGDLGFQQFDEADPEDPFN